MSDGIQKLKDAKKTAYECENDGITMQLELQR